MTALSRRPTRIAAAAAALALALGLGACGESRDEASTTDASPATATDPAATPGVTVTETEYSLSPGDLSVPKTGEVTFTVRNAGAVEHALEVEGSGAEVKTASIEPGGTAELRFDFKKPGRYEWYCPIGDHKERGMEGTIVVAGAGGSSGKDDSGGRGKKKRGGGSGEDKDSGTSNGSGEDKDSGTNEGSSSDGMDGDTGGAVAPDQGAYSGP